MIKDEIENLLRLVNFCRMADKPSDEELKMLSEYQRRIRDLARVESELIGLAEFAVFVLMNANSELINAAAFERGLITADGDFKTPALKRTKDKINW